MCTQFGDEGRCVRIGGIAVAGGGKFGADQHDVFKAAFLQIVYYLLV